jgi:hypothetical protein
MTHHSFTATPGRRTSRSAAQDALRAELEGVGRRIARARTDQDGELERLAALFNPASDAGLRVTEIAELAGVSRQTLINLRNQERGAHLRWDAELIVLLALGAHEGLTAKQLEERARGPIRQGDIRIALDRLRSEGFVRMVSMSGYEKLDEHLGLTDAGIAQLAPRLRYAAMPPTKRWTVYVAVRAGDGSALVRAGERSDGVHQVAYLPAGTAHGMEQPEIGLHVEASSGEDACVAALAKVSRWRSEENLDREAPAVVTMLIPPTA